MKWPFIIYSQQSLEKISYRRKKDYDGKND
jgi:hypothetical protein